MGVYGYGQSRDARVFLRNNWPAPMRPILPPPPMVTPTRTFLNFKYNGPSAWAWFGLGVFKGVIDGWQQNVTMKQYKAQIQEQTAQAKAQAQATQDLQTLQSQRPNWKISAHNGQYIATKLDKEGNVLEEVTGNFQYVMDRTKGSIKA